MKANVYQHFSSAVFTPVQTCWVTSISVPLERLIDFNIHFKYWIDFNLVAI